MFPRSVYKIARRALAAIAPLTRASAGPVNGLIRKTLINLTNDNRDEASPNRTDAKNCDKFDTLQLNHGKSFRNFILFYCLSARLAACIAAGPRLLKSRLN